jgi:hypothetical protein
MNKDNTVLYDTISYLGSSSTRVLNVPVCFPQLKDSKLPPAIVRSLLCGSRLCLGHMYIKTVRKSRHTSLWQFDSWSESTATTDRHKVGEMKMSGLW